MALKLRPYEPDAADEAHRDRRDVFGYPTFIAWIADDAKGNPVKVSVGFPFIVSERINTVLRTTRAELEAIASAAFRPGDSEVVLFAQFGPATRGDLA